ncbi:hypothetical protein [Lyngbya confervoides]|uniref:Conjugal transfer protein n=1 Tax=Lyngbya confervoides BDU141951 TaxID=1574623 RepID=A0ABD4T0Z1_9CYAN|nr:hypothetical protein [Lyngbya confervoides]MCM1982148.1 hypothetical protein [Lyngbya confervoides BDU141951]
MRRYIRINKALGRHAKLFFIDVENIPALILCAAIAFFIGQVMGSEDWALPLVIFIGCFGSWLITVRNKPKEFVAKFHRDHPPKWKRGSVYYTHPLKKGKSR